MSHADGDDRHLSNRILSLLPPAEYERLAPHLRYVELPLRDVIYRPEDPTPYVFFPLGGTASLTAVMRDGGEIEIGVVGREGMAGMPVFLGTDWAPFRAAVRVAGSAVRVKADAFREEAGRRTARAALALRAGVLRAGGADGGL